MTRLSICIGTPYEDKMATDYANLLYFLESQRLQMRERSTPQSRSGSSRQTTAEAGKSPLLLRGASPMFTNRPMSNTVSADGHQDVSEPQDPANNAPAASSSTIPEKKRMSMDAGTADTDESDEEDDDEELEDSPHQV